MNRSDAIVLVVDDDPSVRRSLQRLLGTHGYRTAAYATAEEFLAATAPVGPACLLLDVRLPGLDGIELQRVLVDRAQSLPIVFISGHGNIPMSVQAIKAGAVDFLPKPVSEEALLPAVQEAISRSRAAQAQQNERAALKRLLGRLTPRETEVLRLVTQGLSNRQVGEAMGITERTVKVHRGHVTSKLGVRAVAALVRLVEGAGGLQAS